MAMQCSVYTLCAGQKNQNDKPEAEISQIFGKFVIVYNSSKYVKKRSYYISACLQVFKQTLLVFFYIDFELKTCLKSVNKERHFFNQEV
jgi:hypothetical protein